MADIDFDELDRAVNSVIGKGSDGDQPADAPTSVPVTVSTVARPAPAVSNTPRPSTGRFMDVVHPSSDMKKADSPAPSSPSDAFSTTPSIVDQALQTAPTAPGALSPAAGWPDPIDFSAANTPTSDSTLVVGVNEPAVTGSPFLPGAQVEKRPLGAFSTSTTDTATPPDVSTELNDEAKLDESDLALLKDATAEPNDANDDASAVPPALDTAPAADTVPPPTSARIDTPTGNDTPLPAELQNDLLSIESNAVTATDAAEPEVPTGPVAITQQYHEQPAKNDHPSGAIFDTQSYHQALAHPAKKKSGLWVVLWILLLIAVGGGAGAAVYFFVLPLL